MLRPLCTCVFMIAGCSSVPPNSPSIETDAPVAQTALPESAAALPLTALAVQRALDRFETIVNRVKPVAEQSCRNRAPKLNCQFTILLDTRLNQPPNAFQTLEKDDQPVIVFTLSMLLSAQNDDELAFILGHESAHHIQGHLLKKQQNSLAGALLFGRLTSLAGGPPITVRTAQDIGTFMGGRTYSKNSNCKQTPLAPRSPMQPAMIRCGAPRSLDVFQIRETHFSEHIRPTKNGSKWFAMLPPDCKPQLA